MTRWKHFAPLAVITLCNYMAVIQVTVSNYNEALRPVNTPAAVMLVVKELIMFHLAGRVNQVYLLMQPPGEVKYFPYLLASIRGSCSLLLLFCWPNSGSVAPAVAHRGLSSE